MSFQDRRLDLLFMVRTHKMSPICSDQSFAGNLKQILHKDGWSFIQHLTDGYPGVAKLHGPFGVRFSLHSHWSSHASDTF